LAARNILLFENFCAKISDFGLSKTLYYSYYKKQSTGHLPFKWMSYEALKDSVFTEKSDIWSFGVTAWELFTLGATPYCSVPSESLEKYLSDGNR